MTESPIPPFVVRADGDFCRAVVADPEWSCPSCGGRGGVMAVDKHGYEVFSPCACKRALARAELFDRAQIGRRFAGADFASYQPKNAGQVRALEQLRDFVLMFGSVRRGLLLWGPVGTGKTHLILALFRELTLHKGVPCRFVDFGNLLQDLRRSFKGERGDRDVMLPLVNVELLLVDELGKGRVTEWELTVLDDLISRRYNAGKITLFTSNFDPRSDAERGGAGVNPAYDGRARQATQAGLGPLVERVHERIYSRLCEMCVFVEVPGGDHRRSWTGRA